MSFQYVDLFGEERLPPGFEPPAQQDSPTSVAAAEAIRPSVNQLQLRILELLRDTGPATDEDIAANTQMNPSTERPRRVELVKAGLVAQVGEHKTSSGRRAALWGIVPGATWEESA